MKKYYNAKYDLVFKNVVCTEDSKGILKCILENALEITIDEIVLLNNYLNKENIFIQGRIVDCLVKCGNKRINIEVNNG